MSKQERERGPMLINVRGSIIRSRFVSDAERARRIPSEQNSLGEVVDHGGLFNALDGTHPHSQEEANAADKAYLAQSPAIKGKEPLVSKAIRAVKRAVQTRKF